MLGMTFDIQGPKATQAQPTKLRHHVRPTLSRQRSTDRIGQLSYPSMYTAQFTAWPAGELTELDTAPNRLFRRASANMLTSLLQKEDWASHGY